MTNKAPFIILYLIASSCVYTEWGYLCSCVVKTTHHDHIFINMTAHTAAFVSTISPIYIQRDLNTQSWESAVVSSIGPVCIAAYLATGDTTIWEIFQVQRIHAQINSWFKSSTTLTFSFTNKDKFLSHYWYMFVFILPPHTMYCNTMKESYSKTSPSFANELSPWEFSETEFEYLDWK